MADLIERLNDAWRRLYADGDEHGVCDTIAEAAAALEAARDDGERLDWLERHCVNVADEYGAGSQLYLGTYATAPLRSAIDQARGIVPEAGQGGEDHG